MQEFNPIVRVIIFLLAEEPITLAFAIPTIILGIALIKEYKKGKRSGLKCMQ